MLCVMACNAKDLEIGHCEAHVPRAPYRDNVINLKRTFGITAIAADIAEDGQRHRARISPFTRAIELVELRLGHSAASLRKTRFATSATARKHQFA
jgi:hypothetical protein